MTLEWMSTFARALGVSVEDLMTVPPIGFGAVSPPPAMPRDGGVASMLGDIDVSVGSGHGITTVTGDDWASVFFPGDLLIYDTGKRSTAVPGLYALQVDGEVMTRRVMPSPEGPVISCANPAYAPSLLGDEKVLGRVVARVHRV